ncbi:MAG TPA: hypothetical protein VLV87_09015 [Gammaproteobacteria bacterium]|nr:hypothetical protein [Gammaproteobacteria bacterium]
MKIGILSDLYIDKLGLPPVPDVLPDVLVLAGNIGFGIKGIEWAVRTYDCPIIYVLGNYSYRGHDLDTFDAELRSVAWGSNLHLLQNETLFVRGTRFIGSTLWTDFALFGNEVIGMVHASEDCPDYRYIYRDHLGPITPGDTIALHRRAEDYLWRTATDPYDDGHTVIITHHAPSLRSIPTGYRDDRIAACFASKMDDLVIEADAMLWIHAGVYGPVDYMLGNTRVVANPRGVWAGKEQLREVGNFRADYAIELGKHRGDTPKRLVSR